MKLGMAAEDVAARRPVGLWKGRTRQQLKAKKDRAEAAVKKSVRQQCEDRDGTCRLCWSHYFDVVPRSVIDSDTLEAGRFQEWAHMHQKRRSQTRGQAPEVRHTTKDSLMLCKIHHDQYDGRQKPRLRITALTRKGADGPLKFTRPK